MEHIELVKGYLQKGLVKPGLDYNLLKEVRKEIEQSENAEDLDEDLIENDDKEVEAPKLAEEPSSNPMVRNICRILFTSINDHETQPGKRNELFAERRMAYVVDLDEGTDVDIPSTLMRSGAECPAINPVKLQAEEQLHNKLIDILASMRPANMDVKKRNQSSKIDAVGKLSASEFVCQNIFEDVGDYVPTSSKPLVSEEPSCSEFQEKKSYFECKSESKHSREGKDKLIDRKSSKKREFIDSENIRMAEKKIEEQERKVRERRLKRRRLEGEDDAYAELYPVNIGLLEAAGESDEEDGPSEMDLNNGEKAVKRCNFDSDKSFVKFQKSCETVPKVSFGVKANNGGKIRKNASGEKKKLEKQMEKITKILDERNNKISTNQKSR